MILAPHSSEFADGIYAEMGDFDAAGYIHAVGSGLACMNGPVYIWNHPKPPSVMTPSVVSAALQGHLHVGVFPTVPIKNNDHAIGGDCAPGCPYDPTFIEYGAMFAALCGRRWVLAAHAAVVNTKASDATETAVALANAFTTPGIGIAPGGRVGVNTTAFVVAVTYAPQFGRVEISLHGVGAALKCHTEDMVARVVQPSDILDDDGRAVPDSHAANTCADTPISDTNRNGGGAGGDGGGGGSGGGDSRGCAAVQGVSLGADESVVVTLGFGSSPTITGTQTNAALVILQCPSQ